MRVSAAFLLCAAGTFAQTAKTPPPEVDQALRARVNEFFEYHVEGKFSKAYEMVAEDTKEYYFATQKVQFKSFKIEKITYSDDFTDAVVDLNGTRMWKPHFNFPDTLVPVSMHTTWKIEDGKWVWYDHKHSTWATPMGPSNPSQGTSGGAAGDGSPDLSAAAMQQRSSAILQGLQRSPLAKSEVLLPLDQESSQQIVFHNAQPGSVKVMLDTSSKITGFTAELDKSELGAGQDATITIHFDPKAAPPAPAPFTIRVIQEPLDQVFPVAIKFTPHP